MVKPLNFAVVSIRPFSPPKGVYAVCVHHEDPEMYSLQACSLDGLVFDALQLDSAVDLENQGPSWIKTTMFTLTARTTKPTTHAERMQMLLNALKSRFGLVVRKEDLDREVYTLETFGGGPHLPAANPANASECGHIGWGPGKLWSVCATMHDLIWSLSGQVVHAAVIDHTGLPAAAKYNIMIRVDPKLNPSSPPTTILAEFNQAMKEQLGLRLSSTHATWPTYVIVAAHRPAANP